MMRLLITFSLVLLGRCQYHETLLDSPPSSVLSSLQTNFPFLDDLVNNPLNYFVSNVKHKSPADAKDDTAACLEKIYSLAKSFKSEESLRCKKIILSLIIEYFPILRLLCFFNSLQDALVCVCVCVFVCVCVCACVRACVRACVFVLT